MNSFISISFFTSVCSMIIDKIESIGEMITDAIMCWVVPVIPVMTLNQQMYFVTGVILVLFGATRSWCRIYTTPDFDFRSDTSSLSDYSSSDTQESSSDSDETDSTYEPSTISCSDRSDASTVSTRSTKSTASTSSYNLRSNSQFAPHRMWNHTTTMYRS